MDPEVEIIYEKIAPKKKGLEIFLVTPNNRERRFKVTGDKEIMEICEIKQDKIYIPIRSFEAFEYQPKYKPRSRPTVYMNGQVKTIRHFEDILYSTKKITLDKNGVRIKATKQFTCANPEDTAGM